ncbi:SEC-C metal-binding domain-containing protein [Moritella sp.]|uniref:YecA family protein n=1 Tax=Moritella sp. TaxID=78556 RepID=UPI001DDA59F6|nr:SEC-C metal-binding domain-containing protein [Moritella sp.]MCJ8350662.1 SEC-C domain-containing protein [Moritella sp.]NQZ41003.1 SEC-C domain-containing protein [Moritella sp.]
MKVGRNDQCPCGSGKKYKRCCMDAAAKQHTEVIDDISQTMAMNPNLNMDDLNLVIQHKTAERNNRPNEDFCGLTPTQIANWLYAPFSELKDVNITTPEDLATSPVMQYLSLLLEDAMQQTGSIKATEKGNLPTKLVKQASALLPEFAVAKYQTLPSISEFTGSDEDKFNALHYTRVLAELAGILHLKGGRFHVKKTARKQYQQHGISAFFLPMLEAATSQYNWGYMDAWSSDIDVRTFWVFMLWRLQIHGSMETLSDEVCRAFPDLLKPLPRADHLSSQEQLASIIESRFITRFLQFWGFVTLDPRMYVDGVKVPRDLQIQPLLKQSFGFDA